MEFTPRIKEVELIDPLVLYAWVVTEHAKAKAEFDIFNDCLMRSAGQQFPDFLMSDEPHMVTMRERFAKEKEG